MRVKEFITEWTDAVRAKMYNPDGKTYGKDYENYAMPQLDDPVMDKASTISDFNPQEFIYDPELEKVVMDDSLKNKIEKIVSELPSRDKLLLTLRFGLFDQEENTLSEIAKKMNISPSRVQVLLRRALLRLIKANHELVDYYITEHRLVFKKNAKSGSISMKWRCESGPRKGRTMPDVSHCSAAPDIKKSAKMKQTRQRTKVAQARKTKKTKRVNPMTKTATRLNKQMKK
jgi:RNA polymerase sigma factor (sigma-70 family)